MLLNGKNVRFVSDCEIFPNFDVTGKVLSIEIGKNNEYIFKLRTARRVISVGSNMKNLKVEFL